MALVDYAVQYAQELNFCVFPVGDDCRQPLVKHGYKDASCDADEIRRMWRGREDSNIALAAGLMSGVMVLDVDAKPGAPGRESLTALLREHEPLPLSWKSTTPSGGAHCFFRQPDRAIRNRVAFRPGLDIRTTGGSACLAPSSRGDGEYAWARDPLEHELFDAPTWLLDIVDPPEPVRPVVPLRVPTDERLARYVIAALRNEVDRVTHTPPNTGRNQQLFKSSASLGSLAGSGLVTVDVIEAHMAAAAHTCGLVRDDGVRSVNATIASGVKAGLSKPREVEIGRG